MKKLPFIYLMFFMLVITACHKDIETTTTSTTPTPTPTIHEELIGDLVGYVYDESGNAVQNASVKLYSKTSSTDEYGIFRFKDVPMDKQGTYIKIDKSGYIPGSDFVYPKEGVVYSYTNLLSINNAASFNSVQGGDVNIQGGGKIIFSANSIVNSDGNVHNGKVNVTAKRLATNDPKIGDKMPGGLRGEAANGNSVVLATYGMLAVELRSDAGAELNIMEGMTADVIFPITANQSNDAPAEIPLWHFDENLGLWMEDGFAVRVGDNYEASLPHFSWWNWDAKFPTVHMCVNVFYDNGTPATGYRVALTRHVDSWTTNGYVDGDGSVCGLIPKNETLTLKVFNQYCGEVIDEIEIGPFSNDVQLDDIIIPLPVNMGEGQVVCNGNPVDGAQVLLTYVDSSGSNTIIVPLQSDGVFDLAFAILNCSNVISASVFAYDPLSGDGSAAYELDVNSTDNNIVLNICNNCAYTVEVNKIYTDNCDISTLYLETVVSPAGNYTYTWDDGSTDANLVSPNPGTRCVTVNPVGDNCPVVKCVEISQQQSNLGFGQEILDHPMCGEDNGSIAYYAYGGQPPYTYEVTGPDGFIADSFILNDLAEGTYSLKVTDSAGCEYMDDITLINDENLNVEIYLEQFGCEGGYLYAGVSFDDTGFTYNWSDGQIGKEIYVNIDGNYCVTVTNGNGCEATACFDVFQTVGLELFVEGCTDSIYNVYGNDIFSTTIEFTTTTGDFFTWDWNGNQFITINVLQYGYSFNVNAGNCFEFLQLPHYEGILISGSTNTTCGTCEDGSIAFNDPLNATCYDCNPGEILVLDASDMTDVTALNDTGSLPAGDYIAVLKNFAGNGNECYIDHEYITIN